MKKLVIILLVSVLTSCGSLIEPPKSNTDYKNIIGKRIKIGNLEVAQNDFPKQMNWNEAKIACKRLGSGWRLPTKEELNTLYLNKDKIGGFADGFYWSSTEYVYFNAWFQVFYDGTQANYLKKSTFYVRAIRTF